MQPPPHHTGETLLLIVQQAIHIMHLDHYLLCQMKCHMNEIMMNVIGCALAVWLLKLHGDVICCFTFCQLNPDENQSPMYKTL